MKTNFIFFGLFFLSIGLTAQEFKFPKKTKSASVGIPGTQIMIDQGEVTSLAM